MTYDEAIQFFQTEFENIRRKAADWAMSGWPDIANAYRRDARSIQRRIVKLEAQRSLA